MPVSHALARRVLALVAAASVLAALPGTGVDAAEPRAPGAGGQVVAADLPVGPPPRAAYSDSRVLRIAGRTVRLERGYDVYSILGRVGRLTAVVALDQDRPRATQFYAVTPRGRFRPIGTRYYESYDYPYVFVPETGHIWVNYTDRGTVETTIWQLDVRTGRQLGRYDDGDEPQGLAPADQAVYDTFTDRGRLPADPPLSSPDGRLRARLVTRVVPSGKLRSTVVVRRQRDDAVVARLTFAPDDFGAYDVVFGGNRHVLAAVSRPVGRGRTVSTIVRCDLDGRCARTTRPAVVNALGVDPTP